MGRPIPEATSETTTENSLTHVREDDSAEDDPGPVNEERQAEYGDTSINRAFAT